MLITGARGMAKELFEVLVQSKYSGKIFFFDDITPGAPAEIYGYPVLKDVAEAAEVFKQDNAFVLGLGGPVLRKKVADKFKTINGQITSLISPFAKIGKFGNKIGIGCNIMTGVTITNDVTIGEGVLINVNASISHDSIIGDFTEISPGAVIAGRCEIGSSVVIGANATILPGIKIGNNATVGAGAVVTKDIADNIIVAGVPAKPLVKI